MAHPGVNLSDGDWAFIARVRAYPILSSQEETHYVNAWRNDGDRAAKEKLFESYLKLVIKTAFKASNYGQPVMDLIAEGSTGLMTAIDKFDPGRGFQLATYAHWWIEAAINEYVMKNHSLVKIGTTAGQKRIFFKLRTLKKALGITGDQVLSKKHLILIATNLGVEPETVLEMDERLKTDYSLNAPARVGGDGEGEAEHQDYLPSPTASPDELLSDQNEKSIRLQMLATGLQLARLSDRERVIFQSRRLTEEPVTLESLADRFAISRERVRQIDVRAFEKVQKAVCALRRGLDSGQRVPVLEERKVAALPHFATIDA